MRLISQRLLLAASAATLVFACAKKAEETPAAETPAAEEAAPETEAVEPVAEDATDPNQIGTANIAITLNAGEPAFGAVASGYCPPGGGPCAGGIDLDAEGNVDLSQFPSGDIAVSVAFDDVSWAAGYRFPSDPYQAVAIVIWPAGTTEPTPSFGQANWPAEFQAPTVSSDLRTLTFIDDDADTQNYEYDIGVTAADGSRIVMDPEIKNGGHGK